MASTVSTGFPAVVSDIEEQAYLMIHEGMLVPKLCKKVGVGEKGSFIQYPYFDPTTFSTAASVLTEANDFTSTTALTNSTVSIYASEFGINTLLTDVTKESAGFDFKAEIARQQAISINYALENHCLAALSSGLTTGTVTGTNSTNGFTYTHYAAAKSTVDGKILTVPGRKHAVVPEYSWFWTAKSTFSETYGSSMAPVGEEVIKRYHIKRILGDVDVYRSNYITASTLSTGFMFVTDAVGLWTPRDYRAEHERKASHRGDEYVSTMRAGCGVLIGSYGARLQMYATTPSV